MKTTSFYLKIYLVIYQHYNTLSTIFSNDSANMFTNYSVGIIVSRRFEPHPSMDTPNYMAILFFVSFFRTPNFF